MRCPNTERGFSFGAEIRLSIQRYISTSFWDDRWIRSLDPAERYLYLYLMTNTLTNIAGIYQITMDRISYDTGYDDRTLKPMLQRFTDAGKAVFYHDEWMILPKWPKHQQWQKRSKIRDGIVSVLQDIPEDVIEAAAEYGYMFDLSLITTTIIARKERTGMSGSTKIAIVKRANGKCEMCGKPSESLEVHHVVPLKDGGSNARDNLVAICRECHRRAHSPHTVYGLERQSTVVHNYSDTDSDTDTDSNTDTDTEVQSEVDATDGVRKTYADEIGKRLPSTAWPDVQGQVRALNEMSRMTRDSVEGTPFDTPEDFAKAVVATFGKLKAESKADFWKKASWEPKTIHRRFGDCVTELSRQYNRRAEVESGDPF